MAESEMRIPMEATNGVDVSKAVHGKVVGVIIPPPDIRSVVDKSAESVAKNGKSFEEKILDNKDGKTAKFNFMKAHYPLPRLLGTQE
jgi:splicing factor 3A subunit 1